MALTFTEDPLAGQSVSLSPSAPHSLTAAAEPIRNVNGNNFDLVVKSNTAGEQLYAVVRKTPLNPNDQVAIREGQDSEQVLWQGSKTSVVGENIFNVVPSESAAGAYYGFAQENFPGYITDHDLGGQTGLAYSSDEIGIIDTRTNFCFQLKFTPTGDLSGAASIFEIHSGTKASPTARLFINQTWDNRLEAVIYRPGANDVYPITTSAWNPQIGVESDIRVRLSQDEGWSVWLDSVLITAGEQPAINYLENDGTVYYFPNHAQSGFPASFSLLKWANHQLTKAEVGGWT